MKRNLLTRTVCIVGKQADLDDYCEYLASEAWPVTRIREIDDHTWEVTFAYGVRRAPSLSSMANDDVPIA